MDGVAFILSFICLGVAAFWYAANEEAGADGDRGLLGLRPDDAGDDRASKETPEQMSDGGAKYRVKTRVSPRFAAVSQSGDGAPEGLASGAVFRHNEKSVGGRFRTAGETGYRDQVERRFTSRTDRPSAPRRR